MNMVELIEKKKWGGVLSPEEIGFFVEGVTRESIPDYQIAAMLMAIRLMGMTREETTRMTLAMTESGETVDLSALPGIPVDKHSTGGVGDTTTLVLTPLVAACGARVAKMSGRGLGHTGGTLDKLESIPGYQVERTVLQLIAQVKEIGCAVIGQSGNLAPADKALYSLRDVTATVDSLPLIASSIMCKKLASGTQAIVLDVKAGEGAIMKSLGESIELAQAMVRIGLDAGRQVIALVTDMSEPLGSHVGNALEVKEAIDILAGRAQGPLLEVSLELGGQMLVLSGIAGSTDAARALLLEALRSGRGLETFGRMIAAQGGDARVCKDVDLLPRAEFVTKVLALQGGFVSNMDTTRLGNAAQAMGAGRKAKTDRIDHSVGFVLHKRIGDAVTAGEVIATVHANSGESACLAAGQIREAVHIGAEKKAPSKLIHALVADKEVRRF